MEKQSKSDIAYEYIKDGIIEKRFFPGNRIIEDDIVGDIGVSRTSVRKAMSKLKYEGILESTANRGMVVKKHSISDIEDVFEIRKVLEVNAFELAVNNITEDAIDRMREQNDLLRKLSSRFSIIEYVKYNKNFHLEIANATNNEYYKKYLGEIYNNIAVCLLFYNASVDDVRSVKYHDIIIEALVEKDCEKGKEAIMADNYCGIEDQDLSKV